MLLDFPLLLFLPYSLLIFFHNNFWNTEDQTGKFQIIITHRKENRPRLVLCEVLAKVSTIETEA